MKLLFTFNEPLSGKLGSVKLRWSPNDVQSVHATNTRSGYNTDTSFWSIINGTRQSGTRHFNLAFCKGKGYAEVVENGEVTQIAIAYADNGKVKFKAGELNSSKVMAPYDENSRKGTVLKAALIALKYFEDGELQGVINDLLSYPASDTADDWDDPLLIEQFGKALCLLSNNIYYQFKDIIDITHIEKLRMADVKAQKNMQPILATEPMMLNITPASVKAVVTRGQYAFSDRTLTLEEEALVPVMPETYVFPEWVSAVCSDLQMSSQFSQPMRNVLLAGPAGTGKTKGSQAIAFALNRPHVKLTCQPDTDSFDLIGQMLPNTDKVDMEVLYEKLNLPTFEDVENDFENSFFKLFGRQPSAKIDAPEDCYSEIMKRMINGLHLTSDFTYVESDFIKAVKNGWVVEIQEPTVIKRSAVLVALNSILENDGDTASITLPTGKVIKRHPENVIILTTNANYEGCNPLQQSVLSRMDIVRSIVAPDLNVLVERTKAQTGFKVASILTKMATTIREIEQYCSEHDITDGVCGPRELNNWAKKSIMLQFKTTSTDMIEESTVAAAAFPTVLEKVSQTPEEMEEVITAVFQKYFTQTDVEYGRTMYLAGEI